MRLRDRAATPRLLARTHPLRHGRTRQVYLAPEANPDEYRPVRQQLQQAVRLRHSRAARAVAADRAHKRVLRFRLEEEARQLRRLNEASLTAGQERDPAARFHLDQAKRFRHLNEASLTAGLERNRPARSRLRLTAKVARYHLQSMAGHRRESSVRAQVPVQVVLRIFRHKVAARDPQGKDSGLRRQLAAEVPEKQGRALIVNLADRCQEAEHPLLAGQPEADRPRLEPSAAKSSHNTERNNPRKERRGPARNNSGVICVAAPEQKFWSRFFVGRRVAAPIVGRLCQTPAKFRH